MILFTAKNRRTGWLSPRLRTTEASAMYGLDRRYWKPVMIIAYEAKRKKKRK